MDLTSLYGANVEQEFREWFNGPYARELAERFPHMRGLTLVILDPEYMVEAFQYWSDSLDYRLLVAHLGDEEVATARGGTLENVERKLRFVLRTGGEPSVNAEVTSIHLVLPGDFPWEGAGSYRDFMGGVSGLAKEEDWIVFQECVDKLEELLKIVNTAARSRYLELRESGDDSLETKYLEGDAIDLSDIFPRTERTSEDEAATTT